MEDWEAVDEELGYYRSHQKLISKPKKSHSKSCESLPEYKRFSTATVEWDFNDNIDDSNDNNNDKYNDEENVLIHKADDSENGHNEEEQALIFNIEKEATKEQPCTPTPTYNCIVEHPDLMWVEGDSPEELSSEADLGPTEVRDDLAILALTPAGKEPVADSARHNSYPEIGTRQLILLHVPSPKAGLYERRSQRRQTLGAPVKGHVSWNDPSLELKPHKLPENAKSAKLKDKAAQKQEAKGKSENKNGSAKGNEKKSKFTVTKVTDQLSKKLQASDDKFKFSGYSPYSSISKGFQPVPRISKNGLLQYEEDIGDIKITVTRAPETSSVASDPPKDIDDLLDAHMFYTWTLDHKNKYAEEFRKVKSTMQSRPPRPRDYIVFSFLVCVCCNIPLGLIALCLSLNIGSKYENGDFDDARRYSRLSRNIALLGIIVTIALVITLLALFWPKDAFEANT